MARRESIYERQTFAIERGDLVRTVRTRDGREYSHRCSRSSYEAVAHAIEESGSHGMTTTLLWERLPDVPCTQSSTAVAFMKERGCLEVRRGRFFFPASRFFYEDAMLELHALEHAGSEPVPPAQFGGTEAADS